MSMSMINHEGRCGPCRVCPRGRAPVAGVRLFLACGGRASRCFLPVCRLWVHHVHCSMGEGGCVFYTMACRFFGAVGEICGGDSALGGVLSGVFTCLVDFCGAPERSRTSTWWVETTCPLRWTTGAWLGQQELNLRLPVYEIGALPLGYDWVAPALEVEPTGWSFGGSAAAEARRQGVIAVSAELCPKLPRAPVPGASSRRSLPIFGVPF